MQESFRSASQAEQVKQVADRAEARSGRLRASVCAAALGLPGSLATRPSRPRQSPARPRVAPPARPGPGGGGEERGGSAPVWPMDPTTTSQPRWTGQGRSPQLAAHAPRPHFGPGSRPGHKTPPIPHHPLPPPSGPGHTPAPLPRAQLACGGPLSGGISLFSGAPGSQR